MADAPSHHQLGLLGIDETRIDGGRWSAQVGLTGRPRLVVGGPGTGKTAFLCDTIVAALEGGIAPDAILALCFSRRGVDDVRTRLGASLGSAAQRITIATYHSLAMRLVEAYAEDLGWSGPPMILAGAEQEHLVAELLAEEDPAHWSPAFRSILTSDVMAHEVTDFVLRASEQRFSAADVASRHRADWTGLAAFIDRYHATLRRRRQVDYGLLLSEALRVPTIVPEATSGFVLVVADEYQDTSPVQAELLMACAGGATDLVVAADPYQSIYSFRGADVTNVFRFPDDVAEALDRSVERVILTTSFRVPTEILDAAVSLTARELPGGAGKVLSTRTGGSVRCHEFATIGEEAEWIAGDIERIHLLDGVALPRIAVFVRSQGEFLDDLSRALDRRGRAHTHADERLVDEPIIRCLHDLVRACVDDDPTPALRRVLSGPFFALPHGLVGTLPDDRVGWRAWLDANGEDLAPLAGLLTDPAWCCAMAADRGLWEVWTRLPQMHQVAIDEGMTRHRRAWSEYARVIARAVERSPTTTLEDQTELASHVDFEADAPGDHRSGGVVVATLHRAKGTSFDAVYIANAVEGELPDLRTRDSLLGVRHVSTHLPTDTPDYLAFRLDEERRLAYTAMTRSTSQVTWTATIANERGSGSVPSRFMRLVAPTTPPSHGHRPLTPRAMIAQLRRTAADPTASPVERLASLSVIGRHLPNGKPASTGDALDRYGVRAPGDDTGVIPSSLRLSPSQAQAYDTCPRRYVVERHVLRGDDDSPYLKLGNVVHHTLELAEREALEDGRERSGFADARRHLHALWPGAGFPDDNVGAAWRQRAEHILGALYSDWPSSGVIVDLERPLTSTIGGVPWMGRADRIERRGDSLHIVDYKTSATPATHDEAAGALQLGYYVWAAMHDGDLTAMAPIDGASFWYPAAPPRRDGIATRSFDLAQLQNVAQRLAAIAASIGAEDFPATPNKDCARCTVASTCPAFPVGSEAFAP
jgi:superfamily I DNA/RNA helicase/RecB family exonuclease